MSPNSLLIAYVRRQRFVKKVIVPTAAVWAVQTLHKHSDIKCVTTQTPLIQFYYFNTIGYGRKSTPESLFRETYNRRMMLPIGWHTKGQRKGVAKNCFAA
jgi:hypothetical protein